MAFNPDRPVFDPNNVTAGASLDDLARAQGYADFADMQAQSPQLAAQLSFNAGGSSANDQPSYTAPGPRGFSTVPWGQILTDFGVAGGAAGLGALAGEGGAVAGSGAAGAGGAAATGTGGVSAAVGPTVAAGSTPGTIVAGTSGAAPDIIAGGGAAGAGAAGAGAGSTFLSNLARYISPIAGVANALINRNATNTARDQLVAANQKAQADLKSLYGNTADTLGGIAQRQQQNLSPYVALGGGAAGLLGQGLGLNVPAPTTTPFQPRNPFTSGPPPGQLPTGGSANFMPPGTTLAPTFQGGVSSPFVPPTGSRAMPAGAQAGSGAVPTSSASTGGVRMQDPNTGEMGIVPPEKVSSAQQAGLRIVGGA